MVLGRFALSGLEHFAAFCYFKLLALTLFSVDLSPVLVFLAARSCFFLRCVQVVKLPNKIASAATQAASSAADGAQKSAAAKVNLWEISPLCSL